MIGAATSISVSFVCAPLRAQSYVKDIKPILKERCVVCHNASTLLNTALSGGLALDTLEAMKRGAGPKSKPLYLAGKSGESELYRRLITSGSKLMPKGGPALEPKEIALFKKWIDSGAISGDVKSETGRAPEEKIAPMPAPSNSLEVSVPIRCEVPADLKTKNDPKEASLSLALKVGPLSSIAALAFSPDGKFLAVGSYRAVFLWDTTTGSLVKCVDHLSGQTLSLAFKPDSSLLAASGGSPGVNGDVALIDMKTTAIASNIKAHQDVIYSVAWNSDGTKLATGSQDRTAKIWDASSGKDLKTLKDHSDGVSRVSFSPDGKSVFTASLDHNVRRFDALTGETQKTFTGHAEAVNALALSADGKRIISSGNEPNLRWWNTETGDVTNNNGGHSGPVNDLFLSKDGKTILSSSADHTLRLWDAGNTGQVRAFEGSPDWVFAGVISPDNRWVAGAGPDGVVRLWETTTGKLRLSLISWAPSEKSPQPNWIQIAPEGYFSASKDWTDRLQLTLAGRKTTSEQATGFLKSLFSPESIAKAWKSLPIEVARFPQKSKAPTQIPVKSKS